MYIYMVIVTITTVGYGDFTPQSMHGKFLMMLSALWGAFLISLIILVESRVFDLKKP